MTELYPAILPNKTGFLKVCDKPRHELYWEEYGNPQGEPVLFLHGGPGGGSSPYAARFFDPAHYRIVLFDQRGAGKSRPFASTEKNTTPELIDDIIKLRSHLKIRGKMHLFGGSWGSTLALAFAIECPGKVKTMTLRGIFLARAQDVHVLYQGDAADPGNPSLAGSGRFFPDAWREYVGFIPEAERGNMVAAYHKRLTAKDEKTHLEAARRWAGWEQAACKLVPPQAGIADGRGVLPIARIENHYFMNGSFLSGTSLTQNHIIENIDRIAHIPTEIVHGRYDMICPLNQATDLVAAWKKAQKATSTWPHLHVAESSGHIMGEPEITKGLIRATNGFRRLGPGR